METSAQSVQLAFAGFGQDPSQPFAELPWSDRQQQQKQLKIQRNERNTEWNENDFLKRTKVWTCPLIQDAIQIKEAFQTLVGLAGVPGVTCNTSEKRILDWQQISNSKMRLLATTSGHLSHSLVPRNNLRSEVLDSSSRSHLRRLHPDRRSWAFAKRWRNPSS